MSSPTDHDTDPSTPEAISSRSSALTAPTGQPLSDASSGVDSPSPRAAGAQARFDGPPTPRAPIEPARIVSLPGAASSLVTREKKEQCTDPGVAPPSVPPPPFVPPAAARNTSVDTLLHGIGDPPTERVRVAPQSAGEAVATYHAEHELRAGQQTIPPEPSVVVARLPLTPTVRVSRRDDQPLPEVSVPRAPRAPGPTVEIHRPVRSGPKVVVAFFLSVAVVFVIFAVMHRWGVQQKLEAIRTDPTASAFVIPPPAPRPVELRKQAIESDLPPLPAPAEGTKPAAPAAEPTAPPKAPLREGSSVGDDPDKRPAKAKSLLPPPEPSASGVPMHRFELLQ